MRSMAWFVAAAVFLLLLAGSVTPTLADTYYFVKTYGPPPPGDPYAWLDAEAIQASGDSAVTTPDGYTSVTLDSLHGMGLLSPGEASEAAEDSGTAGPGEGTSTWHYYDVKYITCGSKVWYIYPNHGKLGLACKTWNRQANQPWTLVRNVARFEMYADTINSYALWHHPDGSGNALEWKQEGWFDDGNINNQKYQMKQMWW